MKIDVLLMSPLSNPYQKGTLPDVTWPYEMKDCTEVACGRPSRFARGRNKVIKPVETLSDSRSTDI
jgi:hypothetical protein